MREREIVIRIRLPESPRKRWLFGGAAALVICLGGVVYASLAHPPFGSGEALSSMKLNDDLNGLDGRVTALETNSPWIPVGPVTAGSPAGTFLNGWASYSSPARAVAYRKAPDGMVYLRGAAAGGTAGTTVFQLPVGFRPGISGRFARVTNFTSAGSLDVGTDGTVLLVNSNSTNGYEALDGIAFLAEQ